LSRAKQEQDTFKRKSREAEALSKQAKEQLQQLDRSKQEAAAHTDQLLQQE